MGYTTEFYGVFTITPKILPKHAREINMFSQKRHEPDIHGYFLLEGTTDAYYCQWIVNSDGNLEWDGAEKFYNYKRWLAYLIKRFFEPWGYKLNGEVEWQGERHSDRGMIVIENNEMHWETGKVRYERRET